MANNLFAPESFSQEVLAAGARVEADVEDLGSRGNVVVDHGIWQAA